MPIRLTCEHCSGTFTRPPRDLQRNPRFCSRKCAAEGQKRGGNRLRTGGGYIRIYQPGGATVAEHRLVMEERLGRPLQPEELVHHIDGVKWNNDPANLQVVTAKEHAAIHLTLHDRWAKEHDCCSACGTTERRHVAHGLCLRCHRRAYMIEYRALQRSRRDRLRLAGFYAHRYGLPEDRATVERFTDLLIELGRGDCTRCDVLRIMHTPDT